MLEPSGQRIRVHISRPCYVRLPDFCCLIWFSARFLLDSKGGGMSDVRSQANFLEDPVWLRAGVCFVEFHEMGRGHGNLIEHCVDKT